MSSSVGEKLKLSVFGESHGEAIGCVVDGLPAGIKLDMDAIYKDMLRRAPGRDRTSTPRLEKDIPSILSGVLDGVTTGAPLAMIIENTNTKSGDYSNVMAVPRPSHSDYPAYVKYNGFNDVRGGGHFSGRLTAPIVFAGAVAKQVLLQKGITIGAHIKQIGSACDCAVDYNNITTQMLDEVTSKPFAVFDDSAEPIILERGKDIDARLICLGGSIYLGIHIAKYFFVDENKMIFGILYGLGVGIIILTAGQYIKIPGVAKRPLIAFAFAGIAVMLAEISIVELAKYTWARPRFRYLLQLGSYDRFTPWYRPLGFNFDEGNNVKSFPSGHTAGGAVSYLAMLLPFCTETFKDKTLLCFAVPFVYTSTLAYTRMVMGAHFLTDVTVGGMITFTLIVIATAILDKKHYALKEH